MRRTLCLSILGFTLSGTTALAAESFDHERIDPIITDSRSGDPGHDRHPDAGATATHDAGSPPTANAMTMAIPLYVDPSDSAVWDQVNAAAPTVSLIVANPASGPGRSSETDYARAIAASQAQGQRVIGYVYTSYGERPLAEVEADIKDWYGFYPPIDGIFLDEASTSASTVSGYYQPLYEDIKREPGPALVVLNPGTATAEEFIDAADIIVTFENTYSVYRDDSPASWTQSYPASRFWNVILSASESEITETVELAAQRNVGDVFVTSQGPSTAYEDIPSGAYWQAELSAVKAQ